MSWRNGCSRLTDEPQHTGRYQRGGDLEDAIRFYGELLVGAAPNAAFHSRLHKALGAKAALESETARRIVVLILASPEAQLG